MTDKAYQVDIRVQYASFGVETTLRLPLQGKFLSDLYREVLSVFPGHVVQITDLKLHADTMEYYVGFNVVEAQPRGDNPCSSQDDSEQRRKWLTSGAG